MVQQYQKCLIKQEAIIAWKNYSSIDDFHHNTADTVHISTGNETAIKN